MVSYKNELSSEEVAKRLYEFPDYIHLRRYGFSLGKTMARFPDGAPDRVIAAALRITIADVDKIYNEIIQKLRDKLMDPPI